MNECIANAIISKRKKLGINRTELSRRTGVSLRTLVSIEQGQYASTRVIEIVLKELGVKSLTIKI